MRKYTVGGNSATGTANKTAFNLIGATTIRPLLSEVTFGVRSNPNATDQQVEYGISNTTAVGTAGSNPTPKPLDPQDVVGQVTAGITHSGEPTYGTGYWLDTDMNQRGAYRWVAEIGFEIAGAAVASNGIGGRLIGVTASVIMSQVPHYKE